MTVNKVILVGNLGADPEVKQTRSGTTVARLRLATSERVKDGDQWTDHTEWHRVVLFGRSAENAGRYLTKGSQVYIEGKLRTSSWETDKGEKRYSTEVIADVMRFIGSRQGGGAGQRQPAAQRPPAARHDAPSWGNQRTQDDADIPF